MNKEGSERHALRRQISARIKRRRKKEHKDRKPWIYEADSQFSEEDIKTLEGIFYHTPNVCDCRYCKSEKKYKKDTHREKRELEKAKSLIIENETYEEGEEFYFPYEDDLWWYTDDYQEWLEDGD